MKSSTQIQLIYASVTTVIHTLLITYEVYTEHLYKNERFWSSKLLHFYLLLELLKFAYLRQTFSLETAIRDTTLFKNKKTIQYSKRQRVKETVKSIVFLFAGVMFYAFIAVVLGAPALDSYNETFSLAALLTIFTLLPFVLFVGVDGTVNTVFTDGSDVQSALATSYLGLLKNNAIWVIVGAWSGSILGEFVRIGKTSKYIMTLF
jgi:GPI biosynthesis protein family Pig-F